jgi:hypothetical protein
MAKTVTPIRFRETRDGDRVLDESMNRTPALLSKSEKRWLTGIVGTLAMGGLLFHAVKGESKPNEGKLAERNAIEQLQAGNKLKAELSTITLHPGVKLRSDPRMKRDDSNSGDQANVDATIKKDLVISYPVKTSFEGITGSNDTWIPVVVEEEVVDHAGDVVDDAEKLIKWVNLSQLENQTNEAGERYFSVEPIAPGALAVDGLTAHMDATGIWATEIPGLRVSTGRYVE